MKSKLMRQLKVSVALAGSLVGLALSAGSYGALPASAQQGAEIYATADLAPEGAGSEGTASTATFEHTGQGSTRVTVIAMGLQPNSRHLNHIHDGSCSGPILYPLEVLVADTSGMARAVTELPGEVEFGRWYVNVHAGDTLPSPGIKCGVANPAIAGAPPPAGNTPGMPRTGAPLDLSAMAVLAFALAAVALVTGRYVRSAHKAHD